MSPLRLIQGLIIIVLYLLSSLFSINGGTSTALVLTIVSSFILILWIKSVMGYYTNATLFFTLFGVLYGVLGTISAVWGEGLGAVFSTPYNTDPYILAYNVSCFGIIAGVIFFNTTNPNKSGEHMTNKKVLRTVYQNRGKFLKMATIFSLLGSLSEIINIIRIGGIPMLFTGKGNVQSLIGGLTLTIPSNIFMNIAFAFLGLYLGARSVQKFRIERINIILFFCAVSPYLLIILILGQRGNLATLILGMFIGISYFKPLKRIKPKIMISIVIIYFLFTFLVSIRGLTPLLISNPDEFREIAFSKERITSYINPATNEFGASIANFSEYYGKYGDDFTLRLGKTYVNGLVAVIPSYLYPGEKPQIITFEFRDEFFPALSNYGSIAGTGFSSILEAFINFKYIGVFGIYLVVAYLLQNIDFKYKNRSIFWALIYITSFVYLFRFHRSSFADICAPIIVMIVLIYLSDIFYRIVKSINNKLKKGINLRLYSLSD